MGDIFNIGDRVIATGKVDGLYLNNEYGTVVRLKHTIFPKYVLGIEFDNLVPDGQGHDCGGWGRRGYCRWATSADLSKSIKLLPLDPCDEKEILIGEEEAGIIDRFLSNFSVG